MHQTILLQVDPFGAPGLALPISNGEGSQAITEGRQRPTSAKPPARPTSAKPPSPSAQS